VSKHGPASNIIAVISVELVSTALPIIVIVVGLLMSYKLKEMSGIKDIKGNLIGSFFGTALSTMGMFSTGVFYSFYEWFWTDC
jgi:Na+/H+-translocating membrane pyrophosphatase